jgi:hypothetical protein
MVRQPLQPSTSKDEARPGVLAMRFRGTRDPAQRQVIAREYTETVKKLIESDR